MRAGDRAWSVTGWLPGERPDRSVPEVSEMLARLHAVAPPPGAPVWTTVVDPALGDRLRGLLQQDWESLLG